MPEQQLAVASDTYNPMALMPSTMPQAKDFAIELSKSSLIPGHLQGKPGDCLMVVMQAYRWRMDPFVVANCTSVVHKRLMYEGKLVYAALVSMNAIEGRLKFEISGQGQDASIIVRGTPRGGTEQEISGTVKGWRTNPKDDQGRPITNNWDKDPHSQLVYRGTRQWARLYAPEALLGVYAPEDNFEEVAPPIEVVAAASTVPELKSAAPVEEGQFEPAPEVRPGPVPASRSQAKRQEAQQAAPAAPQAAPAPAPAATQGDELFDDPTRAQAAPAPAQPAAPAPASEDVPSDTEPGAALTESMARVIDAARGNTKGRVSKARQDAKYPKGIGQGNINEALKWLRSFA